MPVSKNNRDLVRYIAIELNLPEEAIWLKGIHEAGSNEPLMVFIWTAKLNRVQLERAISANTVGTKLSARGKIERFLHELGAQGFFTKVKPDEAQPHDLHPISSLDVNHVCKKCKRSLLSHDMVVKGRCDRDDCEEYSR